MFFLGILSPTEFQKTMEKELGIEKDITKKFFQEINRFIFYPVQTELLNLYPTEAIPTATIQTPAAPKASGTTKTKSAASEATATSSGVPEKEKPTEGKIEDSYREEIK